MISIYRIENRSKRDGKEYIYADIRGLSSDTKPTQIKEKYIDNGSSFIEIDTSNIYFYDLTTQTWKGAE